MQTVYRLTANKNDTPIETLHTDFDTVTRMKSNMEQAGFTVSLEYINAEWKKVIEW